MKTRDEAVSSPDELLILVDPSDNEVGFLSKAECHEGNGQLHRAFSVFIFNSSGQLLLQKRSHQKELWNLYWSNSCCSHPHKGEELHQAAKRRINEELSIDCDLHFIYKFSYQESFEKKGSEHELCSVLVGLNDGDPSVNKTEIEDWKYIDGNELSIAIEEHPEQYTPWLKMEWAEMRKNYVNLINDLLDLSLRLEF